MITRPVVFCDPELPDDEEREQQMQRDANAERLMREQQHVEPIVVQMFQRMGLL